ncbi:MAG: nuclear transport factor 2 family protein [Caulobacteraceae bacterium]
MDKVKMIQSYYDMWKKRDRSKIEDIFADDVVYTESYGPEHHGINEIIRWFDDWITKAKVFEWEITNGIEQGNTIAVEWIFSFEYDGKRDILDGVSIAVFDDFGKIVSMKEFQSKHEHYYPYKYKQT